MFGKTHAPRFAPVKLSTVPGPGQYDSKLTADLQRVEGRKSSMFGDSQRWNEYTDTIKRLNPDIGPGSYNESQSQQQQHQPHPSARLVRHKRTRSECASSTINTTATAPINTTSASINSIDHDHAAATALATELHNESIITELNQQLTVKTSEIELLQSELQSIQSTAVNSAANSTAQQLRITELESTITILNQQITELTIERDNLIIENNTNNNKYREFELLYNTTIAINEKLELEKFTLLTTITELNQNMNQNTQLYNKLSTEFITEKSKYSELITQYESKLELQQSAELLKFNEFQSKYTELLSDNTQLLSTIDNKTTENNQLLTNINQLKSDLLAQQQSSTMELESIKAELVEESELYESTINKYDEMKVEYSKLVAKNELLSAELIELKSTIKSIQSQYTELNNSYQCLSLEIYTYKTKLEIVTNQLNNSNTQLVTIQNDNQSLTNKLSLSESLLAAQKLDSERILNEKITTTAENQLLLTTQINSLNTELSILIQNNQQLQTALTAANQLESSLKLKLNTSYRQHQRTASTVTELESECFKLTAANALLADNESKLTETNQQLLLELSELKQQLSDSTTTVNQLKSNLITAESALTQSKLQYQSALEQAEKQQQNITSIESQYQESINRLQLEYNNINSINCSLTANKSKLIETLKQAEIAKNRAESDRTALEQLLNENNKDYQLKQSKFNTEKLTILNNYKSLQKQTESLIAENTVLKSTVNTVNNELLESDSTQLKQQLSVAEINIEHYKDLLLSTQKELNEWNLLSADLSGHLNHKQKIHLHRAIKIENNAYRTENSELRKEIKLLRLQLNNNNNSSSNNSSINNSNSKTIAATKAMRQTLANAVAVAASSMSENTADNNSNQENIIPAWNDSTAITTTPGSVNKRSASTAGLGLKSIKSIDTVDNNNNNNSNSKHVRRNSRTVLGAIN